MSNDNQRADQIAFHFYTKLFYVVNQARATAEPRTQGKVDKWFNLETPDSDLFAKEAREPYKNISLAAPPPLEIQVVLSVPELANDQVLVYLKPDSSSARIEPTPRLIVLESFVLSFVPRQADEDQPIDVALPTIYKHGIPLFRSLYSLLRVLPVWKLFKRLKRGVRNAGHRSLGIQLRVRSRDSENTAAVLEFDVPPSPSLSTPFPTETHSFSPVPHPLGTLTLAVRYLSTPEFQLEELESVLSSRFISQDLEFVPTLTKNSHPSISRSLPKNIISRTVSGQESTNVADRFILPVSRTASNPARQLAGEFPPAAPASSGLAMLPARTVGNPAQPSRQLASGDFGTAQSPSSGLAISRLRKESFGSSPSSSVRDILHISSLSSSPSSGPMAIRRPNINPVHPFKSNTVLSSSTAGSSSSPSLSIRQGTLAGSPLSTGLAGSTHSRSTSVSSSTAGPAFPSRHPPSPIGIGFASARPSPTSLGEHRRPGTSGSTESGASEERDRKVSLGGNGVAIPTRKRYSSSFGHRYAGSVEGGASSPGPAAQAVVVGGSRESPAASYMSANTDDDDISIFVQDIDSRKPLSGRWKETASRAEGLGGHDRDETVRPHQKQPLGRTSSSMATIPGSSRFSTATSSSGGSSATVTRSDATVTAAAFTSPPALSLSPTKGPMLTSQGEVEERLRKMNATFYKTLEGISPAGTNEAKRKERERRRERERERERQRERERESRQNSAEDGAPGEEASGNSSRVGLGLVPSVSLISPTTPSEEHADNDTTSGGGGAGRWAPYSLGMGLRRQELNTTSSTSSSGLLGHSEVAASQGSEEVIGRMDFYEGPRSRAYQP